MAPWLAGPILGSLAVAPNKQHSGSPAVVKLPTNSIFYIICVPENNKPELGVGDSLPYCVIAFSKTGNKLDLSNIAATDFSSMCSITNPPPPGRKPSL